MTDQPKPPGASGETRPPEVSPPLYGSFSNAEERIHGSVNTATERIQVIIEAAEKAAAGIIDDAEAQARNYLEESRLRADRIADQRATEMSSLADLLVERAEAVKSQSDELLRILDDAKLRVEEKFQSGAVVMPAPAQADPPARDPGTPHVKEAPGLEEEQPGGSSVHHLKPVAPAPPGPATSVGSPSDGARLLATQMAVAGSSRPEIESRLRNEFGIHDAGPMLDAILGRED